MAASIQSSMRTQQEPMQQNNPAGMAEMARETAANVAERARDMASAATDKAREAASTVGNRMEDATHAVGSGMESLAGTMRENLPHSGVLGTAASTVAGGLESSGRYLQQSGLRGMAEDTTNLIRRNPIPAMFAGVAVGFLLARLTARS